MTTTMLYKPGVAIKCGPHSLGYIIVPDDEVNAHLEKGWFLTPADTAAPEPEPEQKERKKPGPKPKAAEDGEDKG